MNPHQFRTLGIKTKFLGHGAFREVHRLTGTNLVVKFPLEEELCAKTGSEPTWSERGGKIHTTNEVKKIQMLRDLVPELRVHLPRIYYHDVESGVLVMSYHEEYDSYSRGKNKSYHESVMVENLGTIVTKLIRHITGVKCSDLHYGNVHKKRWQRKGTTYTDAVLIDLGY